jgi:hypothetical protein
MKRTMLPLRVLRVRLTASHGLTAGLGIYVCRKQVNYLAWERCGTAICDVTSSHTV